MPKRAAFDWSKEIDRNLPKGKESIVIIYDHTTSQCEAGSSIHYDRAPNIMRLAASILETSEKTEPRDFTND